MQIHGIESIQDELQQEGYFVKVLMNDKIAYFFSKTAEHRDTKVFGLDYEDDAKGSASAATMTPGRIDVRFHRRFSDQRVARIAASMLSQPVLSFAKDFHVFYQGRSLTNA